MNYKINFSLLILIIVCACSSPKEATSQDQEIIENEEVPTTIVSVGNVSDLAIYDSKPYRQDGAGYQGLDFDVLSNDRNLSFTHVPGKSDSKALNEMIASLSDLGGGKILIVKGNYKFKEIYVKSNIHITIAAETIIEMDNSLSGKNFLFNLGMRESMPLVEDVRIVGLGTTLTRPKLKLTKFNNTFYRAIAIGYIKNALIENLTIEDELTKGSAIALNPVKVDDDNANIAENVTVSNVEMHGASIGYGLAQTNVGKNILLKNLQHDSTIVLNNKLKVTPFLVPHRDEYSETVGYKIEGNSKSALFIPDIDKWQKWNSNIIEEVKKVDYAFVDATFLNQKEVKRAMTEVPHPFIEETVNLFKNESRSTKNKIIFIHFNHTNPALQEDSTERKEIEKLGFNFASEGDNYEL